MNGFLGVGERIVHRDVVTMPLQALDDVNHLGIAKIGDVFLEGEPHYENVTGFAQLVMHLIRNVGAHAVVDRAARENDPGKLTELLCLVAEVIGIDADAVATDEAGTERQEVPLGACRIEHIVDGEIDFLEDLRDLVDERNVDVALGVLDDLCRFGRLDRGPHGTHRRS